MTSLVASSLSSSALRFVCLLAILLFGQHSFGQENAATDAPLRYGWKAGQTLVYSVTVEADRGDYSDILKGRPSFRVTSADGDGITASFSGTLSESRQVKPGKRIIFRGPRRFSPFSPFTGVSGAHAAETNSQSIDAGRSAAARAVPSYHSCWAISHNS
jgi:hypothetical protein